MTTENLSNIYEKRFSGMEEYRNKVWKILVANFFSKWIKTNYKVLDLGCGYGEFINNVNCEKRYAMDLNPKTQELLDENVIFYRRDCSKPWNIEPKSVDLVFTSNFFEHLPNKNSLEQTVIEIKKALKPNGMLIAVGPNISILKGEYWDFWDHHVALSESSLCELLEIHNFTITRSHAKFLPYNMVRVKRRPLFLIHLYLQFPIFWKIFGKQFLTIAKNSSY